MNREKYLQALDYASKKHEGQKRIGGDPYITHPVAVAKILEEKGFGSDYILTGLFHDLLEDTDATESEIEAIGGKNVLEAVKLLTKTNGYVMAQYISKIKENPIAFAVKGADRLHNLKSAVCADEEFKKRYILESLEWYLDFAPEISQAVIALAKTLQTPICKLPKEFDLLKKMLKNEGE